MLSFLINPYYKTHTDRVNESEIAEAIEVAKEVIQLFHADQESTDFKAKTTLIGVGNDAGGKVFSLLGTKFCLKICPLGKHVGRKQEKQFELCDRCIEAIEGRWIKLEGSTWHLTCQPTVAVAVDETHAYTLMVRLDGTIRLWDEENTPWTDKDHWDVLKKVKKPIRAYGGADFIRDMDVNGNNLMLDLENKLIYLIDPYVPDN